jgi:phenylpropionate dioxygenase-like ring-hydroxylating dioxygenase large terminal subunit
MQVVEGEGNCTKFTCPYHMWSYDLTGRLLGAPAMERTEGFDKRDHPLPALAVELWLGFVFVNFDRTAAPLAPTLARYEPYLANYELEDAFCPGTFTLTDLPWNWKVMFENFNDGYHANKLHHTIQDFCPSELAAFPEPWDDSSNVVFRTNGYTHMDGGFNATTKALMPIFPKLTEEERWRSTFALLPPTMNLGTAPDQVFFFLVRPKTPSTIDLEIGYLVHPDAPSHPMFEHLLAMSDAGVQVFVRQDQDATTKVQRGMSSRFAARGRYSWQEASHIEFNRWLVQRYRRHWPMTGTQMPDPQKAVRS